MKGDLYISCAVKTGLLPACYFTYCSQEYLIISPYSGTVLNKSSSSVPSIWQHRNPSFTQRKGGIYCIWKTDLS